MGMLLWQLVLVLQLVKVPSCLAQGVTNLVLGLVVSDVGPSSRLLVLADQADPRGRMPADHVQYVHDDRPLVVFRPGGHVAWNVFSDHVSQHLVALMVIILAGPANNDVHFGRPKVFWKFQPFLVLRRRN